MSGFFRKSVGADLTCWVDWQTELAATGDAVSDDLGWQLTPVETAEDLTIAAQWITAERSEIRIEGGRPERTYMASAAVGTRLGRELRRTVVVRVEGSAA